MGVESYLLRDDIVLYEAGSPSEFQKVRMPDHAVGIVADTGSSSFYVLQKYDRSPDKKAVEASYHAIGSALSRELRSRGIYTKEVILTPSHPEVPLPEGLVEEFGKEKKAFKACSLLWLWLVSPQPART